MWDAFGKIAGQPLWALWGGRWRGEVRAAAYAFTRDPVDLARRLTAFAAEGFDVFKVKIGFDAASDLALAEAARRAVGGAELRLDVNGAWTPRHPRAGCWSACARSIRPMSSSRSCSRISRGPPRSGARSPCPSPWTRAPTRCRTSARSWRRGRRTWSCSTRTRPGGCGRRSRRRRPARRGASPVGLHSAAELGPSQAAYLHLAASIPNLTLAIDTERTYLAGDVARDPPRLARGAFAVPEGPGLGVSVDEGLVARHAAPDVSGAYLDPARPGWFPVKPAY